MCTACSVPVECDLSPWLSLRDAIVRALLVPNVANAISAGRALMAVAVMLWVWRDHTAPQAPVLSLVALIFVLDGVDGIVARRLRQTSQLGSILDIVGDRIVETVFLLGAFLGGFLPAWFLLPFYCRVAATDYCRYVAFVDGKVPADGIHLPEHLRWLTLSTGSRALYGACKMALIGVALAAIHDAAQQGRTPVPGGAG